MVQCQTKTMVVVQTPELLKRVWCAGEIATAYKSKIPTIPLICDGYRRLSQVTISHSHIDHL